MVGGSRRTLAGVAVVLAAAALVLLWRSPRTDAEIRSWIGGRSPRPGDLNVVIVTVDTLRADRLGCYGFKRIETPRIDALARESVLFEQATATVPLTLPSHAAIFTGLIPPHHGVHDNGGFFLDESKTTLAERLQGAGYVTGAFVGAWVLESKWGLAQGFDAYRDDFDLSKFKVLSLGTVQKKGDEVMDGALAWLEAVRSRKFFAWVHLYDPHTPYDPPEPFLSRYPRQRHLGEIAYTDRVVGRLLDWLKEKGLMDRTILVLTADHGESLGEHGESTHGFFIYDATIHVPLIVRTPWGDKGRSKAQVSSVDIFPTILDLVGLPPQDGIDGGSLAGLVVDPSADLHHLAYSETYFPRYHFGWQHLRGVRNGAHQFIEAPEPELYDLKADAAEAANICRAKSRKAEDLRLAMELLVGVASRAPPERQGLDPETLQRLAALGYVGNAGDIDPEAALPDPKSKIGVFALMSAAKNLAQDDHLDEAIAKMREVLAREPAIIDAHLTLGNWLTKVKRPDEAVAEFKEVLALKPDSEIAMSNLAHIYRARGQADAAIEGYRGALRLDPKSPQNWYQLATLLLDLGKVDAAEATFREALAANPKMGAAYNGLGVIAFSRGKLEEAEGLVSKGLELESKVRTGRFNLGRVLEARGDVAGAEAHYRAELATYPDHGKARFNLAQVLRQRGDRDGFLRELATGVEKAPDFGPCYFFLAREELAAGRLDRASDLARRGLGVDGGSEIAPLGHYVLADVHNRRGQRAEADAEVGKARRLESSLRRHPLPKI